MNILHTESSAGWGGQEIRILREAEGMRDRGHSLLFVVQPGGGLASRAREKGFIVYEYSFHKRFALSTIRMLMKVCKRHSIDIMNTHSSKDAWLGGIAARILGIKLIRTRHLSTPSRPGLNCRLLYKTLADCVVTTSSCIIPSIQLGAKRSLSSIHCIPTGVDPHAMMVKEEDVAAFRESIGVQQNDILIGTTCFVRSWKGIQDLFQAALILKERKEIKWLVVGGGYVDNYRPKINELGLSGVVTFVGHIETPFVAMRAMDIFTLLSTAHEGISQASIQAAFLERPLITTTIGGLPEVCIDGKTGLLVPPFSPEDVAQAAIRLIENPSLRQSYGKNGKELVLQKYTFKQTLDSMQAIYDTI